MKSRTSADLLAGTDPLRAGRPAVPRRAGRYLLAGLAAAAVALAGCSSPASPDRTGADAKVALTFKLIDTDSGPGTPVIKHWTLTCEPAGGSQPNASAACAVLTKLTRPFAPHPMGVACPMILRSNRRILVTGTWLGTKVHRLVTDGGCDLALFSRLDKIFR